MQQIGEEIGGYLQAVRQKLSNRDYAKLCVIKVPGVHQFIAESAELCNPERIFVSDDSLENIAYIRNINSVARAANVEYGIFGILRDLKTGEYLNSPRDNHVWVKWMELRAHHDFSARVAQTGLIPKYEDLRLLFKQVLNKGYSKENYTKQFAIRVPENLAKIDRVEKFYREKVADAPNELFVMLTQQRGCLLKAREEFGMNYIPPERFRKNSCFKSYGNSNLHEGLFKL